ncbi:MAG: SagB/ThcOx family dehydrogenase [Dehalococcoidia bacterium]|nr:SagB/ThcOx family dehydrogenase [Dehalococcoidia bacterium]
MSLLQEQGNPELAFKLPPPRLKSNTSLEETIAKRRSIRRYGKRPLTPTQVAQLLWSAQGITGSGRLRAAPSAGATYPLEIFILTGKGTVEELAEGIYHYEVDRHSLTMHLPGDSRRKLAGAAFDQGFIANAPMDIVICALYGRTSYRYGRRGERYVSIETGHVAQNVHLQATALGLATVEVGAFDDEEVRKVLQVQQEIRPLYMMPVGNPL